MFRVFSGHDKCSKMDICHHISLSIRAELPLNKMTRRRHVLHIAPPFWARPRLFPTEGRKSRIPTAVRESIWMTTCCGPARSRFQWGCFHGFSWLILNFGELGFMEDISDIYSCWWGYKQTNLRKPHSYKCKSWWIQHDITTVGPWINHDQLVCWMHFCWENM